MLSHTAREEIRAIVFASVNAATAPLLTWQKELVARQNELEARLERAEREARTKTHPSSIPPPPFPIPPPFLSAPVARARSIASMVPPMPAPPMPSTEPPVTRESSVPPQLIVHASNRPVASVPLRDVVDLESLARMTPAAEFEGYDGGRRRRRIAAMIIGAALLGLLYVVVATILSHV